MDYRVEDFVRGGTIFRNLARLSAAGIAVVTVTHGSSTAGGAYQTGLSDYIVMVRGRTRAFLAGPPLLRAATGEIASEEELGGAQMHASISGLGDFIAEDDRHALGIARRIVADLGWEPATGAHPGFSEPAFPAEDLLGIMPADWRRPVDMKEVIARVVDGSVFDEIGADYGSATVCGHARVKGRLIGIVTNNGPLDPAGANKATHFIQLCCQSGTPLVYLNNTTGFMVGRAFEEAGMIKHGSKMLQAVANADVPQITFYCGASFGAGNYGMCGRGLKPRFCFSWPNAVTAVMGPDQAAGTMEYVAKAAAAAARRGIGRQGTGAAARTDRSAFHQSDERLPHQRPAARRRDHRSARHTARAGGSAGYLCTGRPHRAASGAVRGRAPMTATPFSTLLVANRGEIALRIIRTARRMGYRTVAIHSRGDAGSMHVRAADLAVALDGETPATTYLDIDAIIDAARRSGADAVHPGYGFLSENPAFAQACAAAGLVFVGPSASAIALMGNKAAAKQAMRAAGVPCIPGYDGADQGDERLAVEAEAIGYPVMIKAAMGGGGRGMRLVQSAGDFPQMLRSARSEAKGAFGDDAVILEKMVPDARHVEIQVFGDRHGNAIHLGERDCSVQRRHQKLVEEAPSPAITPKIRAAMGEASIAAVRAIGYEGAGTLEYLLGAQGDFHFMEMNTRLQVEHTVTEAITGLDLVELQLRIAAGEPIGIAQGDVRFEGHAIQARLCAEDPANSFLPQSGRIGLWRMPTELRVDTAMETGAAVSPHHDSMIAKLAGHGVTREDARRKLLSGLGRSVALGLPTNRAFLSAVLSHPDFVAGQATTAFVEANGGSLAVSAGNGTAAIAAAVLLRMPPPVQRGLAMPFAAPLRYLLDGQPCEAGVRWLDNADCEVTVSGTTHSVAAQVDGTADATIRIDGVERAVVFIREGDAIHFALQGRDYRVDDQSLAPAADTGLGAGDGVLRAATTGQVRAVNAVVGDAVEAGEPLVVIDAMKLENAHSLKCSGIVGEVLVRVGDQVQAGQVLLKLK